MKLRRFKTRNGSIIEEWPHGTSVIKDGFIDDYKIIESEFFDKDDYICLFLKCGSYPTGGQHGEEWDIIEEVV